MQNNFEQQWQKITSAYLKNEIRPYDAHFCFCGTLCDNSKSWFRQMRKHFKEDHHNFGDYTGAQYVQMEQALLETISRYCMNRVNGKIVAFEEHPDYELAIFEGMSKAIEILRNIHLEQGDETAKLDYNFTKRVLVS